MAEYLKTPPDRSILVSFLAAMGVTARDVLRRKGTPYDELGLVAPKWTNDELIDLMIEHPVLINRPTVVTELGTQLCRLSQTVLDTVPQPQHLNCSHAS